MRGVGPGTVLGGRYTVRRRVEQRGGTERWTADDTTLGRRVSVLAVPSEDHRTAGLLDGARRAASVNHQVFVRILDVGSDDDVSYVVEEDLEGAHTLTELVVGGGVPGDEVRRITGEVAAALESARQRGMHHLDLTPDDIMRTPEGEVRLRGLEIAAVRAGEDGLDAEEAGRRDAVGVVALAYAGLTGLWPLGSGGAGLAPAPRVPGGVAAPSEIAAGVPRDLDALCRLTLNDDQGPTSPGDYARQVAPWPTRQVVGRPVIPLVAPPAAEAPTDERPVPHQVPAGPDDAPPPVPDDAPPGSGPATAPLPAVPVGGGRTEPLPAGRPAAQAASSTGATAVPVDEDDAPTRVLPVPRKARPAAPPAAEKTAAAAPAAGPAPRPVPARAAAGASAAGTTETRDAGNGAGSAAAAGAAGAAVVGALGTVGTRVSDLARRAVDRVSELTPDPHRDVPPPDSRTSGDHREDAPAYGTQPAGATAVRERDDADYPAPLVPAEPLTKDESKLALAIVAGFVVLALVFGIIGVSRIGSNTDFEALGGARTSGTPTPTASTAAPSASASPTPGASAPAEPLAVLGVRAYDPDGDGAENNRLTPRTYDGDPDTGWFSENYRSDRFGGLKPGLGLIVDLGPNKKPQEVRLDIPVAADVAVYVGPDARLEGARKVGERADASGAVAFPVPAAVSGQYIIVWYTGLTVDDEGKRRATLDEIVVTG